uniref:Uncharacterized protein n=1 Tax=Fusarium oxysporum (strain Fo5176) TaxID=660025 RepID=A0A0D2YH57_FUSOF
MKMNSLCSQQPSGVLLHLTMHGPSPQAHYRNAPASLTYHQSLR